MGILKKEKPGPSQMFVSPTCLYLITTPKLKSKKFTYILQHILHQDGNVTYTFKSN